MNETIAHQHRVGTIEPPVEHPVRTETDTEGAVLSFVADVEGERRRFHVDISLHTLIRLAHDVMQNREDELLRDQIATHRRQLEAHRQANLAL
jgi:hypothetical protein